MALGGIGDGRHFFAFVGVPHGRLMGALPFPPGSLIVGKRDGRRNAVEEWSGLVPSRGRELIWRSLIFGRGELLDKLDDGSPKLWVRDLHERFGELVSIGGGEIVCYVLRIGSVGRYTAPSGFVREPFEEGFHGHLQYMRNLL
jgi:hypothetical protein